MFFRGYINNRTHTSILLSLWVCVLMVVKKGSVVIWPNKIPSIVNVYMSLFHAFSMGFKGKRQLLLT